MDRGRSRVLALAVVFAGLVIASLFVLDWFIVRTDFGSLRIDLREVHACPAAGPCVGVSLTSGRGGGFYPALGAITFWGGLAFTLLVGFQAVTRLLSGVANPALGRIGYLAGALLIGTGLSAGYVFGPEPGAFAGAMSSVEVVRTWAPLLLVLGIVAGFGTLYFALAEDDPAITGGPAGTIPAAKTYERNRSGSIAPGQAPAPPITPLPTLAAAPATDPGRGRRRAPTSTGGLVPEHLRSRLQFSTLTVEVTRGGLDARREDGHALLVVWRDVVGVVARRMPAKYDGLTFVDVVSREGSTLRVLPWTRLSGDPLPGVDEASDDEARARALVKLIAERCTIAKVDPATRRFIEGTEPAAQLPDLETLAAHDTKLA